MVKHVGIPKHRKEADEKHTCLRLFSFSFTFGGLMDQHGRWIHEVTSTCVKCGPQSSGREPMWGVPKWNATWGETLAVVCTVMKAAITSRTHQAADGLTRRRQNLS